MIKGLTLMRKIPVHKEETDWVGYWVFRFLWWELMVTKCSDVYPQINITFYNSLFYFLRLSFEIRYRE